MILANHRNENTDDNQTPETHPKKKRLDPKNVTVNPNKTSEFVNSFIENPADTRFNRNMLPSIQNAHTQPLKQNTIKDKKPSVPKIIKGDKFSEKLVYMPYQEYQTPKRDDFIRKST